MRTAMHQVITKTLRREQHDPESAVRRAQERAERKRRTMYVYRDPVCGYTSGDCAEWNAARDVPEANLYAVVHPGGAIERLRPE